MNANVPLTKKKVMVCLVMTSDLQAATVYEFAVRTIRGEEQSRWSLPVVNTTQQTGENVSPCVVLTSAANAKVRI